MGNCPTLLDAAGHALRYTAHSMKSIHIHAGPRALARIRSHGLQASDIGVIPAAAGGPKGLIFQHLDQWLFGQWLPTAPRERLLIGASIGAWRMAAACHADPVAAFGRLSNLYCEEQRYPDKPSAHHVSTVVRDILNKLVGGHESEVLAHPWNRLVVIAARGAGSLAATAHARAEKKGFAVAALANALSRRHLARHMERVLLQDARAATAWLSQGFDPFTTRNVPLTSDNLQAALLSSGTLPLVMEAVRDVPHAPPGAYWDGGLVDYHLALPYHRLQDELVLYPHFGPRIVPGWLDKHLPWRHAARLPCRPWLDNLVLISPTEEFLRRLPRKRLPDRRDFPHYGLQHERRIADWRTAIAEGERLRDELAAFVERPDAALVKPL